MLSITDLENLYTPLWEECERNHENCQKKMMKRDKIIHIHGQIKKGVAYSDAISNPKQWSKYEVEIAVLQADITTAWKKERKNWKQMDSLLCVNRANTTYKKVDGNERRALEREPCVICFETYDAKRLTTTSCNHTFCRPCFSQLIETCYFDDKEISCPYCRNEHIRLSRYYK